MIKCFCDRCGKEMSHYEYDTAVKVTILDSAYPDSSQIYNLCSKCEFDFRQFIKDEKEGESQWSNKVEHERMELNNKICNLTDFLKDSQKTADLSPHMLYLLREQLKTMTDYYNILEERIKEGENNDQ